MHTSTFHRKTLQDLPKSGLFGLKICHLATQGLTSVPSPKSWKFETEKKKNNFNFFGPAEV
jgi:hypothetical protein